MDIAGHPCLRDSDFTDFSLIWINLMNFVGFLWLTPNSFLSFSQQLSNFSWLVHFGVERLWVLSHELIVIFFRYYEIRSTVNFLLSHSQSHRWQLSYCSLYIELAALCSWKTPSLCLRQGGGRVTNNVIKQVLLHVWSCIGLRQECL